MDNRVVPRRGCARRTATPAGTAGRLDRPGRSGHCLRQAGRRPVHPSPASAKHLRYLLLSAACSTALRPVVEDRRLFGGNLLSPPAPFQHGQSLTGPPNDDPRPRRTSKAWLPLRLAGRRLVDDGPHIRHSQQPMLYPLSTSPPGSAAVIRCVACRKCVPTVVRIASTTPPGRGRDMVCCHYRLTTIGSEVSGAVAKASTGVPARGPRQRGPGSTPPVASPVCPRDAHHPGCAPHRWDAGVRRVYDARLPVPPFEDTVRAP